LNLYTLGQIRHHLFDIYICLPYEIFDRLSKVAYGISENLQVSIPRKKSLSSTVKLEPTVNRVVLVNAIKPVLGILAGQLRGKGMLCGKIEIFVGGRAREVVPGG
jgi:hypothetical protein